MYISKTKIRVRYAETDQMGIVYNANYNIYFEVARGEFVAHCGLTYKEMEETGIMMPLIETHCKYYEGAKYDDELVVETNVEQLSPAKVIFQYKIVRESDQKLITLGKTVQAFVDKDSFKIMNLKKKHPDIWDKMSELI